MVPGVSFLCVLYYDPVGFVYVTSASRRNDIRQCFSKGWLGQLDEISRCTKCMDDLPILKEATTRPIFLGGYFIHPRWCRIFSTTVSLYYPPLWLPKPGGMPNLSVDTVTCQIVTGSFDKTAKLWDANTGQCDSSGIGSTV